MSTFTTQLEQDTYWMEKAFQLSLKGRLTSAPNPWVGCIIVKNNLCVGSGFHEKAGRPHAEVVALAEAKEQAQDATAYITLEPCPNYGRTPPCSLALIRAKIKRVVIGIRDPDPQVAGKGIEALKKHGIEVEEGILSVKIRDNLKPYLHHRSQAMPYCIAKAAVSLDGKLAACDHTSQWISSEEARLHTHQLRASCQAILIGLQTAIKDRPRLTVRTEMPNVTKPLRVVLDTYGQLPVKGPLFDTQLAPTLIATSQKTDVSIIRKWEAAGVQVKQYPIKDGHVDIKAILHDLAIMGVLQVLVEGGNQVYTSLLEANLINEFYLYIGNCILGSSPFHLFSDLKVPTIAQSQRWHIKAVQQFGETVLITYEGIKK